MKRRASSPALGRRLGRRVTVTGLVALLGVACLLHGGTASAQSSTNFRLAPGVAGPGGSSGSTNFRLVGEAGPHGRFSSTTRDIVSGFIGGAFSSQATVVIAPSAGQYASIAFPVTPPDPSVAAVLDELGGANVAVWRFAQWSPGDAAYREAGGSLPLSSISPAQGYWLITRDLAVVRATGLPKPLVDLVEPLESGPASGPGWNQVGNPFLFPINVSDLHVFNATDTYVLDDPSNNLTEQVAKVRIGNAYQDASVINGRTAFWVHKLDPGPVSLIIRPFPAATGSPEPAMVKPPGTDWAVAVRARQDGRASEPLVLGAGEVAANAWNPHCRGRAPAPPGGELSVHVVESGWGRMSGEYVRHVRARTESAAWDLVVSGAESPAEVALEFSSFDLPSGARVWLADPAGGWSREVEIGRPIAVAAHRDPRRLRLSVAAGDPAPGGVAGFRAAYPNPFSDRVGLTFVLSHPGEVGLAVFDVAGRRVRGLGRAGLAAGEHVLVWDGRDDRGAPAASGVYLVRYDVGGHSGVGRIVKAE
jgi:flagellar hook capping protein FlgD